MTDPEELCPGLPLDDWTAEFDAGKVEDADA